MSEEKLTVEAFLEEASDMKNKIKELEQRLLTFEALYTDIDHKRLGALEKKYELNKENIPKTIHKYYNKNKEKIAELRNQIQNNSIADLNHYTELKDAGSARQTVKTTRIWKLDPKILNEADKYILVAREDLEQAIKRESWLLDQLFPTHYGSDDFNKIWGAYITFKKKYLKEEEDAP